ncbi:pleckstrin homology domain-containing family G member 3 isoform X3 [Denticeps clupeoides]|uniref:pleckstrin homology domain-containing family G member 3 isoform X3 n=1 Tax=Denticeps clupeoides TaxID=299321 RepID=UPI0010A52756|nr:pleckstrin homology domain-containing family G member 3-like isoform X3 [Denticeps clupeoides]
MGTVGRVKGRNWGMRPELDVFTLRAVWEDRKLLNGLNRRVSRLFESPRLSTGSISSNERASTATLSDCSDHPNGQRPVSLVSTLSSGSGSSRDEGPASINPASGPSGGDDIDLELCPSGGGGESQEGRSQRFAQQNNNNAAGSQPLASLSPFAVKAMAPNPSLTYVDRVVMEIIESERMYVRDLRSIVEDYLAQIIDTGDLPIRPEQVCALFGNIEDIYEFNSELLQALDMCDNDPVAIARCFVLKSEYFEIYTQYCTNYPNSVAALTECMRNKILAKFFRDRQAALKRSLPLGSYLLKPVQRILKYHLLLQEIAKHFDPEEDGYEVVEEAIYTMTGVGWYINDMKRKHEHAVRLQEVQSLLINWKGPDLTTYGELVLEGTFRVHRAKNERTLFLFDRMLLITKRRGEHYVYKTFITCSTLMLIESAKDSLCFSVTHYKHPKQPHTVQAKTVEERKLWTHHIKRLILENHQAIIPQKAKEAILEMDSIYRKYRYSPERMKKAVSCQSDEFPNGRQGRRQSEPSKQILKSTKAVLKHADSDGALPGNARPVQRAASISTLTSSIGEFETERPSMEEEEADSVGRLIPSEELRSGQTSGSDPITEEIQMEEIDPSDILMEDDQVADFASSMLAAISCWHYRARALLSMGFTTDEDGNDVVGEFKQENGESTGKEDQACRTETCTPEQGPEDKPDVEISATAAPAETAIKASDEPICSQNDAEHRVDLENAKEQVLEAFPMSQQDETPALSSEDEDEGEAEVLSPEREPSSILPPSVLDQAGAIAEHFICHTRRSSLAADDVRSLGCPSPRQPSRTGSILSLGGEAQDRGQRLNSTSSDALGISVTQDILAGPDQTFLSPRDDYPFEAERSIYRRRDSILSRQEQLLIDKIKSYYENAEHQDASFGLKRRESLTYIPTGLVRNSVTRLNSIPKDESMEKKVSSLLLASSVVNVSTPTDGDHIVFSASFDSLDFSKKQDSDLEESTNYSQLGKTRSQSLKEASVQDEEFIPSSDMIKVWQEMEREVTKSQAVARGHQKLKELSPGPSRRCQFSTRSMDTERIDPLLVNEESDLSTITEESGSPSPNKERPKGVWRTASLNEPLQPWSNEGRLLRVPVPRVIQLRAEADMEEGRGEPDDCDSESAQNNKVFHLARKYSQRIKCSNPVVRQRSQDAESILGKRNLPCVLEENPEKESKDKTSLTLSLVPQDKMNQQGLNTRAHGSSPSPAQTPSSLGSPRVLSPGRAHAKSPLSPTPLEGFIWPDVRELRSKYASSDAAASHMAAVGRSHSVPEKMVDGGLRRRSSYSSSLVCESTAHRPHPNPDPEEGHVRQHRTGSLDQKLSRLHLSELENKIPVGSGYYVSGEATLANDKKMVVLEKSPAEPAAQPRAEKEDHDDKYVQIRSPTTREKISIMAVIDRCRAYQESEEYKLREEGVAKAEPTPRNVRGKELEKIQLDDAPKTAIDKKAEASQQGVVKNLREKFLNLR